jgi:hypothetical protein
MGGIPQQFHGLQVSVDQRFFVPKDVDDEQAAARPKHAVHFLQGGLQPRPVMSTVASASQVETGAGKGQRLCARLARFDIRQASHRGGLLDRGQHARRWIECNHARETWGERKAQVPGAAADVDGVARPKGGMPYEIFRMCKVGALGVYRTGQVGMSPRIELILNGLAVCAHSCEDGRSPFHANQGNGVSFRIARTSAHVWSILRAALLIRKASFRLAA